MKSDEWIRDPVFQLNLLVWMAKEQPTDGSYCVRPFFHEVGFEWLAIEQPFAFPVETQNAIRRVSEAEGIKIRIAPEPELILKRERDKSALYFEAKANSFGAESTTAAQAMGHLLATGPAFAESMHPLECALLVYMLPQSTVMPMAVCLNALRRQLLEMELAPGDYSVCGLSIEGSTLNYHLDPASQAAIGANGEVVALITGLTDDTDPAPLLLIYSDEDYPDHARRGQYRRVVQNQAVANLLCELHHARAAERFTTTAATILEITSQGAFSYLGRERRKGMERLVRENVFVRIRDYWLDREPDMIVLDGRSLEIDFKNEIRKTTFLDWLESKRVNFEDSKPTGEETDQMLFKL